MRAASGAGDDLLDFCVPVNRHFPVGDLIEELVPRLSSLLRHYPDYADVHQNALAAIAELPPENIVAANGSTELITLLCRTLRGPVVTCAPTFGRWTDLPQQFGVPLVLIERREADEFRLTRERIVQEVRRCGAATLVLSNPNNPTGSVMSDSDMLGLLRDLHDLPLIIIDESFIDFAEARSVAPLVTRLPQLVVVKSLGKSIGWHGLRLGYAVAHEALAKRLRDWLPYWNINGLAAFVLQQVAQRQSVYRNSFAAVRGDRDYLSQSLRRIGGLRVFPSDANFIHARVQAPISGRELRSRLLAEHRVMIRECGNKLASSEQFLRIAVNPPDESDRLAAALRAVLPAGDLAA